MAESARDRNSSDRCLDCRLVMNSSADKLSDIFRSGCAFFPGLMPDVIKSVEEKSPGVWLWTFVDDKCGTWENSVARNNQEPRSVTWTFMEGPVPKKLYNALSVVYSFFPKDKGCEVTVKLTYKMKNINVQPPNSYMGFICGLLAAADNNPPE